MNPNKKLFVRNLSWSVTEDELYNLFAEAGDVLSVKIPTRREDGKPRGFAFVEMNTAEEAQRAIRQFNGTLLSDRDLVVDYQEENRSNIGSNYGGNATPPEKNSKLFIRNVSYGVAERELQALFEQVGTVISVRIPTDRDTGEAKPFAFVEMASVNEAQNAIERLNNTSFQGRELAIDFQDPNRNKNNARPGGGGYSRAGGNAGGGYGQQNRGSNRW